MGTVDTVMAVLRGAITEKSTDRLLDIIFDKIKLPKLLWPFKRLVKAGLDYALPDTLLDSIEKLLREQLEKPDALLPD